MKALSSTISGPITGLINVPGDKSISHRALIISSLSIGKTKISGLLQGQDVFKTKAALENMGVEINNFNNIFEVNGLGSGGLIEPNDVLYLGNSGTSARLLIGIIASHKMNVTLTGDNSLRNRPMNRVIEPALKIGANIISSNDGRLPITISGTNNPIPIEYELPLPSAQVKSAVLLAGLQSPGESSVIENIPSRDHTERMLEYFGAKIKIERKEDNRKVILIEGQSELNASEIIVPGDFSSAAFFIVAALITPNSDITLKNIGINPYRTGLSDVLKIMGGDIQFLNKKIVNNEPVADIRVRYSSLNGTEVPPEISPTMIDEYPILSIAACFAEGKTVLKGLNELKHKESNRIKSIFEMLGKFGVNIIENDNDLIIDNKRKKISGNCIVQTFKDHRIAMSAIIAGMTSKDPIHIDDFQMIDTSFPGFMDLVNNVGGNVTIS